MKKTLFILLCTFVFQHIVLSQVTNTRNWRKTEKDSLDNALILYDEKNYLLALPVFEKIHYNHPQEDFVKYIYAKCALQRSDKHEEAYNLLKEVYAKNKKVEDIEYDLAKASHFNNKLDEAQTYIDAFAANKRTSPEGRKNAEQLKKYIAYAKIYQAQPTNAKITNLSSVINGSFDEYVPAIPADESFIIFTYAGNKSKGGVDGFGKYLEDIYMGIKIDNEYKEPFPLDSINTTLHDAAVSLSLDGDKLYTYKDNMDDHGDLYESQLTGVNYTKPKKLRGQVNTYSWEGHCSLSPDGKTLYFSSDRGGGFGGRDIYKATLMADSTWGNIQNLGDSINTRLDDDSPYIHADGRTLYFSSKGRTSMGGYDIFQAQLDSKDSTFKSATNLGFPINSCDDDIYFVVAANGKTGYYSSGKKGGQGLKDIYAIETNFTTNKPCVYLVKGVTTRDNSAVEANATVNIKTKNGKLFKSFKSNAATGKYIVALPCGEQYSFSFADDKGNTKLFDIDASSIGEYKEEIINVDFNIKQTPTLAVTPTISATPTVALATKTTTNVDDFKTNTLLQAKIKAFAAKYGDIDVSGKGIQFRVQVAAYKYPKNYKYDHLNKCGKIESVLLDDGITRITIGGKFNTLNEAWTHNKKVITAGQTDAFVTAIYQNKRIYLEDLVKMGVFVDK